MKCASVPSAYRNCILRASVRTGRNFSPARNVRSITAPSAARRSLVRTNAPPLPGLTCWNSRILKTVPSTSMWLPFLNWFVEIIARSSLGGCAGRADALEGLRAMGDRLGPGDADHALAVGFEDRLALGVVLAGEAVVVPFGAVGLDDQALSGPAEVGDDAAALESDRLVDVGTLKTGFEDEVQDGVLELASCGCVAGGEDLREVGGAGAGAEAVKGVEDLGDRDELALGFADGSSEGAVLEGGGQVDEGAGGGGDRDAFVAGGDRALRSGGRGCRGGLAFVPRRSPRGSGRPSGRARRARRPRSG